MSTPIEPLKFPRPYENFLVQYQDHIHQVLQDIMNCRVDNIRRTPVKDMEAILNLFKGTSLNKKREALVEFLRIMPEYRTTDQELLYQRLKALKEHIKTNEGYSDLYLWALWKYRRTSQSESEA